MAKKSDLTGLEEFEDLELLDLDKSGIGTGKRRSRVNNEDGTPAAGSRVKAEAAPSAPAGSRAKEEPAPAKPKKHHPVRNTCIVIGILLVAAAGFAGYEGYRILDEGGAFNEDIFFVNTTLNGVDISGMTVQEAYDAVTQKMDDYTLTISGRDEDEVITGSDIDLACRPELEDIQAILDAQNANKLELLRQYFDGAESTVELTTSYDVEKAQVCISALHCLDSASMVAPVDSTLQEGDTGYYVTDSVEGNTLDVDTAEADIAAALAQYSDSVDLEALGVYSSPTVTADDATLNAQASELNALIAGSVTYDMGDRTYTIDSSVTKDFLIQDETGAWMLDDAQITAWVDTMADETDTYGKPRTYTTHDGDVVDVNDGDYGWEIDREATSAALIEALHAGQVTTLEPEYTHTAMSRNTDDIGGTYVEVDLTNQKVYLYVDGECTLETDCVSGTASNSERKTPSWGVWSIKYKQSPAVLGTYEVQGYESHVTYWMPFNGGVGLHDADGWRSAYGGNIYKYSGSHGCVNLPRSNAKIIYEAVSKGTAVVVYGE